MDDELHKKEYCFILRDFPLGFVYWLCLARFLCRRSNRDERSYAFQPHLVHGAYGEVTALVTLDDDKYGYINDAGEFIISPIFDHAKAVKDGHAIAAFYEDEYQYGILEIR